MTATRISHLDRSNMADTLPCVYTVADAARRLGVSQATIRRAAKDAGVVKIGGRVVAGYLLLGGKALLPYAA